ncbi:MAG: alpha/beta hydrolase [Burkholderiales bacterium]|nr:alpha/beta hydrolase [Burkholderiales bacterium]
MSRDILHFSHANGFPAASYHKFLGDLESDFRIGSINCIGHDPAYPVTDGWPHLLAQLIDHLVAHYRTPVVGMGHSLGGYLTFMAAVQRPELFKCIILLDAPISGHFKGTAFGMLKRLGMVDRITPARATRERRRDWTSTEEMIAHFGRRKIFRDFDPDCLRDYAERGAAREGGRVRLLFDPEIEYQIYRSVPHDLVYYCNRLKLPAGFIGGRHSNVLKQVGLANTRRNFRVKRIEGGHLFPFERPQAAAEAVRQLAAELLAG